MMLVIDGTGPPLEVTAVTVSLATRLNAEIRQDTQLYTEEQTLGPRQ